MQHHSTDHLNVEVAHVEEAAPGFADNRETLGEHVVQRFALFADALAKHVHASAQLVVAQPDQTLFKRSNLCDALLVLAKLLSLADIQRFFEQTHC
uniref:Unannotated protein n=1 Tax=freshwater metagenome TaxID=449393 RepID=A0A6J6A0Z6_9ZZZZ